MTAILVLGLALILFVTTPWHTFPRPAKLWATAAVLNTVICFALPVTPATSPWRPVIASIVATTAALSVALVVLGMRLRRRLAASGTPTSGWMPALLLAAMPAFFYALAWAMTLLQ